TTKVGACTSASALRKRSSAVTKSSVLSASKPSRARARAVARSAAVGSAAVAGTASVSTHATVSKNAPSSARTLVPSKFIRGLRSSQSRAYPEIAATVDAKPTPRRPAAPGSYPVVGAAGFERRRRGRCRVAGWGGLGLLLDVEFFWTYNVDGRWLGGFDLDRGRGFFRGGRRLELDDVLGGLGCSRGRLLLVATAEGKNRRDGQQQPDHDRRVQPLVALELERVELRVTSPEAALPEGSARQQGTASPRQHRHWQRGGAGLLRFAEGRSMEASRRSIGVREGLVGVIRDHDGSEVRAFANARHVRVRRI